MTVTLLYDRECGFCRWAMGRVLEWDRRGVVRPLALQDPEAGRLLEGLHPSRRLRSWHLVDERGTLHSAGAAVAPLMDVLPFGAVPALVARLFPRATDRAYRVLAANRERLGALLGEDRCAAIASERSDLRG